METLQKVVKGYCKGKMQQCYQLLKKAENETYYRKEKKNLNNYSFSAYTDMFLFLKKKGKFEKTGLKKAYIFLVYTELTRQTVI